LLLAAVSGGAGAELTVPRFERGDCPFEFDGSPDAVQCGTLVVAENRDSAGGRTLRLAVAVIRSTAPSPRPDPIVFLSGGPGGASVKYVANRLESPFWNRYRGDRDLVFFDQRGTGYSEPRFCPEMDFALYTASFRGLPVAEQRRIEREAAVNCRDKMLAAGIDFAAYNSRTSARDLDELRQALGYESWNLFGVSYGTRLALAAMRDTPAGIRSVVLDSVTPPNAPAGDDSDRLMRSLRLVFDQCAADPRCKAAFPALEEDFFSVIAALEERPIELSMADASRFPDGRIVIDGTVLAAGVFQGLYYQGFVPFMPLLIREVASRNESVVEALANNLVDDPGYISQGQYYSVECYERIPFAAPEAIAADRARHPRLAPFQEYNDERAICGIWHTERAGADELQAVHSEIPALVAAGEYDPITPPAYARLAAESLPNATYVEVTGAGHGALVTDDCTRKILQAFLDDPGSPTDTSCIDSIERAAFITDAYVNPGIYRLIRAFQPTPNVVVLGGVGLMTLTALSAIVAWPVAWLRSRRARRSLPTNPPAARVARNVAFLAALLIVLLLAGLGWAILDAVARNSFLPAIGVSDSAAWLFILPWAIAALTAGVAAFSVAAWKKRWWSATHRVHFTLVAAACAGFVTWIVTLGILQ